MISKTSDANHNCHRKGFRLRAFTYSLIIFFMASFSWTVSASPETSNPTTNLRSTSINLQTAFSIDTRPGLSRGEEVVEPSHEGIEITPLDLDPITPLAITSQALFESIQAPNPTIQKMLDQVDRDTINTYTGDLSGEWPVQIGGQPYTIRTRHTYSGESIRKATEYAAEHLTNSGLDVEIHNWESRDYPNVIGQITGQTNPEDIYLITAHIDDMPSGSLAPGADDNASGTVATLIAADILSKYQWGCTLRFALWTGEEQGFDGSEAYAKRARARGENILGVLNLDMIGYSSGSPTVGLFAKSSIPESIDISNLFIDVVQVYGLDLDPNLYIDRSVGERSDNQSFWEEGYPAILATADAYENFNPYYHTTNDRLATLNLDFYIEFIKAAVGTFAHMADCLIEDLPEPTFVDVPLDYWAHDYIEALYQAGYTTGCSASPLMYCPDRTLDRAEGAVFTVRGAHGADFTPPQPTEQIFADTLLTDWPVDWITQLWNDGYTAGCSTDPLSFCTWDGYNRAQGSVFALRIKFGVDYVPPAPAGIFEDVSSEDWFIEWVEAAYNEGLIPACQENPLQFCAEDPLDRAMAAYMLVQVKGIQIPQGRTAVRPYDKNPINPTMSAYMTLQAK